MRPVNLAALAVLVPGLLIGTTCAGATVDIMVSESDGSPLGHAVVSVSPMASATPVPEAPATMAIDQVDKEFVGPVTVVPVGAAVSFPNNDDIRHHVYSFSPPKRFELPLYAGTPAEPVIFDKPGLVKLGCNIHDWMVAYVYVTEAPFYGLTGEDGKLRLDGLSAGRYRATVWHSSMKGEEAETAREFDVGEQAANAQSWSLDVKRIYRPRRAPMSAGGGYR